MKNKFVILIVSFLIGSNALIAQNSAQGIFMTAYDFRMNKISYPPIKDHKYKLQLNDVFYKSTIKIEIGDEKYEVNKNSIFGYRDAKNAVYRFVGAYIFKVINPTENILLYCKNDFGGYKNLETTTKYYFSQNDSSAILPLAKWDLNNAFKNDSTFHELLDIEFSNDAELIKYDSFYKMYKINRLFQFSHQLIHSTK